MSRPQKPIAPDIDGYLDKLKHKTSIFGSWTRRYFRVNVGREKIEYYTNQKAAEKSDNASGTIDLVNFRGVKKFDNITFQLDGGSDGVFLLRADSNAELACWMNGLEIYLKEKVTYDRYLESIKANKRREQLEREEDNLSRENSNRSRATMMRDPVKAVSYLEKACTGSHAPSCYNLVVMYLKDDAGIEKNEANFRREQSSQ